MAVFEDFVQKRQGRGMGNHIIIDLYDAASKEEILQRIGNTLRGRDSPRMVGFALDALIDVVSAWMTEQDKIPRVMIINAGVASFLEEDLLAKIVASMHFIYLRVAIHLGKQDSQFWKGNDLFYKINIDFFV